MSAQPYGNEWIDYGQSYFKFPVQQDGAYRIDRNTLLNAGIPLSMIDPRNIQLFSRGMEVPLYISGESDGSFDPGDFIEFYGRGNDGFADSELYSNPLDQAHPLYSLFNDTIYYFLTWNASITNLRFQVETDVAFSSYAPSSYVLKESINSLTNDYFEGQTFLGGGTDPTYAPTEGWFDFYISLGSARNRFVPTVQRFVSGPPASVKWKLTGQSDYAPLNGDHHLRVQIAGTTFDTIYEGYQVIEKNLQVPVSALNATNTSFVFSSINDLGSAADRSAISYLEITYAHNLNFNNSQDYLFIVPDQTGQSKSYLNFTGLNFSGNVWVYDLTNGKRIRTVTTSSNHEVLIPNGGSEKECYVFSEGNVNSVSTLKAVNGNGMFTDIRDLEVGNAFLIISHPKLTTASSAYAAHRNSTGYGSVVLNVSDLYDQFAFGIVKHPLAIRHAVKYIVDSWNDSPEYLFLLGKSVKAHEHRKDPSLYVSSLVPSFGNPASDILMTAGYKSGPFEPLIPTGRLSASSNQQVLDYLDKVQEYENNQPQPWMKNALHFAGGFSKSESDRFSSYLNLFGDVLSDTLFGANVRTFQKSTSEPFQVSLADSIQSLINRGTSFMTFFGHSSTTGGFDQNVDDPEFYNNKGRYPLVVGNSCFTGNIHEPQGNSTSEKFVLTSDRGAIAFLASVDLGYESYLRDYSLPFFKSIAHVNYGKPLAEHTTYAIRQIQGSAGNFGYRSVAFLMTLHGDPAIVINSPALSDLSILAPDVTTNPSPLTTQTDSFELVLDIYNFGRATGDSVQIEVARTFPDLQTELTSVVTSPVNYNSQVRIKLPVYQEKNGGFNRFDITIDPSNFIQEYNESNNFVSVIYFIKSGDIVPVMPYRYAVVPNQNLRLKASTGYSFEKFQEYEFQLDTNASFAFPLESTSQSGVGGVYEWSPQILRSMIPGEVYFWRARNKAGGINSIWRSSSFRYIPGRRGWSQDHFDQITENELQFLYTDSLVKQFKFLPSVKQLACQTSSTTDISQLGNILYKIDADLMEYGGCGLGPAIHIAILDSLSFEPWGTPYMGENSSNYFGQVNFDGNCGKPRVQRFFIFRANNAAQLAGLKDLLNNKVPNGNYILAWTWVRNDFSVWDALDPGLRAVFSNMGASGIGSISNDTLPYIFFVKKGKPATAAEVIGNGPNEFVYLKANLSNFSSYGSVLADRIGPSSRWDSLAWNVFSPDNPLADSARLNISSLNETYLNKSLFAAIDKNMNSLDLNSLDANIRPFMEMDAFLSDVQFQTAPQLDEWTVYYEGVPELAINARLTFDFHRDTVQEGELIKLEYHIENISDYNADSVLVSYYVIDRNRQRRDIATKRLSPIDSDSGIVDGIEFSSLGLKGINTLVVEVNPGFDQIEQSYFNNIGQLPFYVTSDLISPILDVTFDGRHILDGEIVSARPNINIELSDENEFLILDDTSDFQVFLSDVNQTEHRLYFTNTSRQYSMEFTPAGGKKNKARVTLEPKLGIDGIYSLRVVATDRSKNESGLANYRISFEVINRSTITNLLNYPNPFSTSTRFVFVLTGSKVPDNIQIQIMTVSGKLVKTVDLSELGPVHIGRNISSYAWDGKDEYGDKLANGVYLYRVNTRLGGAAIEQRSTSADKYFKNGFGKMVILR
ncbi:MAG: C25 family cysteine peptidase [Vicingaceae bacterium]